MRIELKRASKKDIYRKVFSNTYKILLVTLILLVISTMVLTKKRYIVITYLMAFVLIGFIIDKQYKSEVRREKAKMLNDVLGQLDIEKTKLKLLKTSIDLSLEKKIDKFKHNLNLNKNRKSIIEKNIHIKKTKLLKTNEIIIKNIEFKLANERDKLGDTRTKLILIGKEIEKRRLKELQKETRLRLRTFINENIKNEKDFIVRSDALFIESNYKVLCKEIKAMIDFKNIVNKVIENLININILDEVDSKNEKFMEKELTKYKKIFDDIDGKSLDTEQRRVVVTGEKNTLAIAGAGSGKTLTISAKYKYLIDKGYSTDEILLISFTRKAADEMKERIEKLIEQPINSYTFHSLGLDIISEYNNERPNIIEEQVSIINEYFNEIALINKTKTNKIMEFLAYEFNSAEDLNTIEHIGDVYSKYSIKDYETIKSKIENKEDELKEDKISLKREYLKSMEEVMIANFLYLNGIEYEYEKNYPWQYTNKNGYSSNYNPDFYLVKEDIYLEHFGVNEDYKCPWLNKVSEYEYIEGIKWKRELHKEKGTTLIETYSYMHSNGELLEQLKSILKKNGVSLKKIDYKNLYKEIFVNRTDDYFQEFKRIIGTFISLFKSKGYNKGYFEELKEKLNKNDSRNKIFLEIIENVYTYYEISLARKNAIDFNDMINSALQITEKGGVNRDYKYIIIDEYQDISYTRFKLIDMLRKNSRAKILAVGDDWQSIYRFTGSDINLFTDFDSYFGYTEKIKIKNVYRNPKDIIKASSKFILENDTQIKKGLVAHNKKNDSLKIYGYRNNFIEALKHALNNIINKSGETTKIFILGRNNFDINILKETDTNKEFKINVINDETMIKYKYNPNVYIRFLTAHKSKGLEADNVIIINMNDSHIGFPNKVSDDSILGLVLINKDDFEYEEERRLFYVSMTRTKDKLYLITQDSRRSIFVNELIDKHEIKYYVVEKADELTGDIIVTVKDTDVRNCRFCKTGELVIKEGYDNKPFLACNNYPACRKTYSDMSILEKPVICSKCGDYMVVRNGYNGKFYGCSNYPTCTNTINIE